jgi:hypothetical protein
MHYDIVVFPKCIMLSKMQNKDNAATQELAAI